MRNKILSIVLMFVLFMGLLYYGGNSKVYAAELPNVVKSARITDTEGNPLTGPIGAWQAFRITADYELPNNQVHAGDTTTIELPQGFDRAAPFNFEIKAGDNTVATGKSIVTAEGKHQIILTYTDYAETHSEIKGSFYFNIQINNATQTQTGNIPVTLVSSGENVSAGTVQYNPQQVEGVPLIKAGWMDSADKTIGHYKINVNQKNEEMKDAVLEDTLLTPGMNYVKGSLSVTEGTWVNKGTDLELINKVDVTAQFADKIKIKKENEKGEPLKNAKFDVIRVRSGAVEGKLVTDENGLAEIGNLLKDDYKIKETDAPEGYEKLAGDIDVKSTDFDNNQLAYKVIKNKKKPPEKISVEGKKIWNDNNDQDGKRPDQIVINLLKNGVKFKSKTVKKDDGWKWKFEGLDKYENGKEIKYTITEEAINGYSTEILGYDVKNTRTPGQTSVQVTKTWKDQNNKDGMRPKKVRIRLLANGVEILGKILELSEMNGWTGTFTKLPINKNGKKIEYTVKEEPVGNGYQSFVTGNAKEGFVITNLKKSKPPVTPPGGGGKDPENPQTGDKADIALYASLLAISGITLSLLIILKRKKKFSAKEEKVLP